jgi:hypothetical protein
MVGDSDVHHASTLTLAQAMHAAVDVRVLVRIEARHPIDRHLRFLRRRGAVEVYERLGAHVLVQEWGVRHKGDRRP